MLTLTPPRADAQTAAAGTATSTVPTFDALLADIRARRAEFAQAQQMSRDVVDGFLAHGVYRALVPKRYGGNEWGPHQFCELIERIAQADGSAGWVASFGMGVTYLAGLPRATLDELYGNGPDVVFAGGIFPPQPAPMVAGGFEVTGRWSFASGCTGATVVGVGISPTGGEGQPLPRMAVMPREKARIERNWNVVGLSGTGSHDLVVEKVVVPEEWTFIRGAKSNLDEPMFRYPTLSFATQVLSVVALGIARGAIEELRGMAGGRVSITGAPQLGDRPLVQMELARCEAQLRAARAFFYDSIDEVWDCIVAGDTPTPDQVSMLRLSSTHATRAGAEVTRAIQMLTGMTGIQEASPLSMQVRDSLVVTQHAFMGDITFQNAGAMLLGRKPLPGYL